MKSSVVSKKTIFKVMNSSQIARGMKPSKVHISLPISGFTELLHDPISLTVRFHTYYLLFDDVLNSNYHQDDISDAIFFREQKGS